MLPVQLIAEARRTLQVLLNVVAVGGPGTTRFAELDQVAQGVLLQLGTFHARGGTSAPSWATWDRVMASDKSVGEKGPDRERPLAWRVASGRRPHAWRCCRPGTPG